MVGRKSTCGRLGQTPHHRPAKTVFSTVPSNSDWQSELQGSVENRSSLAGGVAFDFLRCWKGNHCQQRRITNVANQKRHIISDYSQIQLTNTLPSAVDLLASGSELHCTGLHICQLDLLGIAVYIVFSIGFSQTWKMYRASEALLWVIFYGFDKFLVWTYTFFVANDKKECSMLYQAVRGKLSLGWVIGSGYGNG